MGRRWQDPFLGWRVWRLRPEGLRSWAAGCYWQPGPNAATCLSSNPCPAPPGNACRCGYWALFSLTHCLHHARVDSRERMTVLGLVQGWGEVALHGEEGFRAANAAVVALFTDWVWDTGRSGAHARPWWWRLLHVGEGAAAHPDPNRDHLLTSVAKAHGVPVLPLRDALRSGFLAEVGLDAGRRQEVARLLQRSASKGGGSSDSGPGRHGVSDAA